MLANAFDGVHLLIANFFFISNNSSPHSEWRRACLKVGVRCTVHQMYNAKGLHLLLCQQKPMQV